MMNTFILIPALNPGNALKELISDIREIVNIQILIVDDGSNPKIDLQFDNCEIIQNVQNRGKGFSLKKDLNGGEIIILILQSLWMRMDNILQKR